MVCVPKNLLGKTIFIICPLLHNVNMNFTMKARFALKILYTYLLYEAIGFFMLFQYITLPYFFVKIKAKMEVCVCLKIQWLW